MPSYATVQDLYRFGAPAAAFVEVSTLDQEAALEGASGTADGYLRAKFKLPLTAVTTDLTRAVCQVAAYDLLSVRGFNPEQGSDINVRSRYEDAIRWLEQVAKGTVTPALTDSSVDGAGGPFVVQPQPSSSGGLPIVTPGAPRPRGW